MVPISSLVKGLENLDFMGKSHSIGPEVHVFVPNSVEMEALSR